MLPQVGIDYCNEAASSDGLERYFTEWFQRVLLGWRVALPAVEEAGEVAEALIEPLFEG
jgi:hypothetical protein